MHRHTAYLAIGLIFLFSACDENTKPAVHQPRTGTGFVHVGQSESGFVLYRGGKPYLIKGAGAIDRFTELARAGGNSIRTWGAETAQAALDSAASNGLTVTLGLWVGHERHGFDYNDPSAVAAQKEAFRKVVLAYKDHPALLIWGIGNEVELNYTNPKVWNAINDIAKMIHEIDPNHPTMTVLSYAAPKVMAELIRRAPEIDILGINAYRAAQGIGNGVRNAGWNGPYIVTEWGTDGHWESEKTTWGAPIELPGSTRATLYKMRYQSIYGDTERCLGSYAFFWGQKQERTPTWYSLFVEKRPELGLSGETTEAVDVLTEGWTGKPPANRSPSVNELLLNGQYPGESITLAPGQKTTISLDVTDPDADTLRYVFEVMRESEATSTGGDREDRPQSFPGLVGGKKPPVFQLTAPKEAGNYRLFVYVLDQKGHAGTANCPFRVK